MIIPCRNLLQIRKENLKEEWLVEMVKEQSFEKEVEQINSTTKHRF